MNGRLPSANLVEFDPGCVKTLRGITAPGIFGPMVMRRAKKCKNLSSARHYDQIRFCFHTTKTRSGAQPGRNIAVRRAPDLTVPISYALVPARGSKCGSVN